MRSLGQETSLLLDYYEEAPPIGDRGGLIVLSMVLPDDYNRGYESARLLVVDQINEQKIESLEEVEAALQNPIDGYHRILFMPDEALVHMVLDADELEAATQRILERYRIPEPSFLGETDAAN